MDLRKNQKKKIYNIREKRKRKFCSLNLRPASSEILSFRQEIKKIARADKLLQNNKLIKQNNSLPCKLCRPSLELQKR